MRDFRTARRSVLRPMLIRESPLLLRSVCSMPRASPVPDDTRSQRCFIAMRDFAAPRRLCRKHTVQQAERLRKDAGERYRGVPCRRPRCRHAKMCHRVA